MKLSIFAVAAAAFLCVSTQAEELYKYIDSSGHVIYSDVPMTGSQKVIVNPTKGVTLTAPQPASGGSSSTGTQAAPSLLGGAQSGGGGAGGASASGGGAGGGGASTAGGGSGGGGGSTGGGESSGGSSSAGGGAPAGSAAGATGTLTSSSSSSATASTGQTGSAAAGQTASSGTTQAASSAISWYVPCFDGEAWLFRSGLGGTSRLTQVPDNQKAAFGGTDGIDPCNGKGVSPPAPTFAMGGAEVQYEGGDLSQRWAYVADDPAQAGNRILQYGLRHANVLDENGLPLKGRVQMNLNNNRGVKQVKMSVRMYLHQDFAHVRSFPGAINWLTISEWWNNAGWTGESFPFRIAVHVVKEGADASAPFFFKAHAQTLNTVTQTWDTTVWERVNRAFVVPVGQWVTLEYGFREGDPDKGRFFMAVTPDGGERTVIFDVYDYTHHPNDRAPDGLSQWNPVKLYTSKTLIDHVRSQGGVIQIHWDDLQYATCRALTSKVGSPCAGW
jgi:hypothetical protein